MSRLQIVASILLTAVVAFALGRVSVPTPEPAARANRAPAPADATGAAVHEALMRPDPVQRAAALGEVLDGLGSADLPAVQAAFDSVVLDSADYEVQLFVLWWARFDAPAATAWAKRNQLGRHPSVMAAAVRAWAQQDPLAARDWVLRSLGGAYLRSPATAALLWGWAESGQDGAFDYVANIQQGGEQQTALALLVRRRLLRFGPEATFRWAEALPDDEPGDIRRLKLNTYRRIGTKLVDIDPEAALRWAARVGEGEYGDGVYGMIAWAWARTDGLATMEWALSLPPGPRRQHAIEEGYRRWIAFDRDAAFAWLASRDVDPALAPAYYWRAITIAGQDMMQGFELAEQISDRSFRERAEFMIARGWRNQDREAADAWLAGRENGPELIARIESHPTPTPGSGPRAQEKQRLAELERKVQEQEQLIQQLQQQP